MENTYSSNVFRLSQVTVQVYLNFKLMHRNLLFCRLPVTLLTLDPPVSSVISKSSEQNLITQCKPVFNDRVTTQKDYSLIRGFRTWNG